MAMLPKRYPAPILLPDPDLLLPIRMARSAQDPLLNPMTTPSNGQWPKITGQPIPPLGLRNYNGHGQKPANLVKRRGVMHWPKPLAKHDLAKNLSSLYKRRRIKDLAGESQLSLLDSYAYV